MMKNITTRYLNADADERDNLLLAARIQARKECALNVTAWLESLAAYIQQREMSTDDVAELLRGEAIRVEHQSQELH